MSTNAYVPTNDDIMALAGDLYGALPAGQFDRASILDLAKVSQAGTAWRDVPPKNKIPLLRMAIALLSRVAAAPPPPPPPAAEPATDADAIKAALAPAPVKPDAVIPPTPEPAPAAKEETAP